MKKMKRFGRKTNYGSVAVVFSRLAINDVDRSVNGLIMTAPAKSEDTLALLRKSLVFTAGCTIEHGKPD